MLIMVYMTMNTPKMMMNVHEPPNEATESATRSPSVSCSSITSFGWRSARMRMSCWAA